MTRRYTEDEVIANVDRLTRTTLSAFVAAEVVAPVRTEGGMMFHDVDLVRMELLCELSEAFSLEDDALGVVISLVDQLHAVRGDLRAVLEAVATEPEDVRTRIAHALQRARGAV